MFPELDKIKSVSSSPVLQEIGGKGYVRYFAIRADHYYGLLHSGFADRQSVCYCLKCPRTTVSAMNYFQSLIWWWGFTAASSKQTLLEVS